MAPFLLSAVDGPMPNAGTHPARPSVGVPALVVFLNKCDLVDDAELLDLIELEARELLTKHGFPGEQIPFVRGNAVERWTTDRPAFKPMHPLPYWNARIVRSLSRSAHRPAVPHAHRGRSHHRGRGTVATGRIEQGVVPSGKRSKFWAWAKPQTFAPASRRSTRLWTRRSWNKRGLLLRGVKPDELQRGQVIAAPRTIRPRTKFKGEVYVLSKTRWPAHAVFGGYKPQFFFRPRTSPAKCVAGRCGDGDAGRQRRRRSSAWTSQWPSTSGATSPFGKAAKRSAGRDHRSFE